MKRLTVLLTGMSLLVFAPPSYASDHLFTAVGAGGLTTSSQPFVNPKNPGTSVPGQGSPLSGQDTTTPAVEVGALPTTNAFKTPPPVGTVTAPNSPIP